MDHSTKQNLKARLAAMSALTSSAKGMLSSPLPPAIGGVPAVPIQLQQSFALHLNAMKMVADELDKLTKVVAEIVDKS